MPALSRNNDHLYSLNHKFVSSK